MPLEDVLDAEHEIGARDLAHAALVLGRTVQMHRGLPLGERVDAALSVAPEDFDQRRGIALADAIDRERAAQSAATMQDVFFGACSPAARAA